MELCTGTTKESCPVLFFYYFFLSLRDLVPSPKESPVLGYPTCFCMGYVRVIFFADILVKEIYYIYSCLFIAVYQACGCSH